ncbi:Hypothetical predicted protein, partial [Scomber scombrus]
MKEESVRLEIMFGFLSREFPSKMPEILVLKIIIYVAKKKNILSQYNTVTLNQSGKEQGFSSLINLTSFLNQAFDLQNTTVPTFKFSLLPPPPPSPPPPPLSTFSLSTHVRLGIFFHECAPAGERLKSHEDTFRRLFVFFLPFRNSCAAHLLSFSFSFYFFYSSLSLPAVRDNYFQTSSPLDGGKVQRATRASPHPPLPSERHRLLMRSKQRE